MRISLLLNEKQVIKTQKKCIHPLIHNLCGVPTHLSWTKSFFALTVCFLRALNCNPTSQHLPPIESQSPLAYLPSCHRGTGDRRFTRRPAATDCGTSHVSFFCTRSASPPASQHHHGEDGAIVATSRTDVLSEHCRSLLGSTDSHPSPPRSRAHS